MRNSTTTTVVETAPQLPQVVTTGGCEDCNNQSDPVTLEDFKDLPPQYLFKVRDEKVTHCFDIRSLNEYYEKCGKLENPLTRAVFSEETLADFLKRVLELGLQKKQDTARIHDERTEQERHRERQRELEDIRAALGNETNHELDMLIAGHVPESRRHRRHQVEEDLHETLATVFQDNPIARAMVQFNLDGSDLFRRDRRRRQQERPPSVRPHQQRTWTRQEPRDHSQIIRSPSQRPLNQQLTPPSTRRTPSVPDSLFTPVASRAKMMQDHENVLAASRPSLDRPTVETETFAPRQQQYQQPLPVHHTRSYMQSVEPPLPPQSVNPHMEYYQTLPAAAQPILYAPVPLPIPAPIYQTAPYRGGATRQSVGRRESILTGASATPPPPASSPLFLWILVALLLGIGAVLLWCV